MKAMSVLEQYDEAVQFEDNLSSHKTDTVSEFWDSSKCYRKLYPPELTQVLQPIVRHIGIQYKTAVYQDVRSQSMKLLRESKGTESIRLNPLAKRVLITKAVADTHNRLAISGGFRRSFIATGTRLPSNDFLGAEVKLEGVNFK